MQWVMRWMVDWEQVAVWLVVEAFLYDHNVERFGKSIQKFQAKRMVAVV